MPYLLVATTERHAEGPRGAEVRAHARLTRPRVLLKQNADYYPRNGRAPEKGVRAVSGIINNGS